MSATPSTDSPQLDVLGIMSVTTGGLAIAHTVWGQLLRADRYAFHVNNGHGMEDDFMVLALVPGLICAALAIALGTAALRGRAGGRTWPMVGVIVGAVAVAFTVSGIPVELVPNPRVEPEVP